MGVSASASALPIGETEYLKKTRNVMPTSHQVVFIHW